MSEIKQKRIQILLKLFGEQIKQKIVTEKLNISVKELLNKFVDYEITETGKYLEWMIKCYIANGFLYEDLYKVKETLEIFHENKMKLSRDKKDIQQYKTLADLWIEVKKFVEQKDDFLSTNEQKRKEKELAYSETEFLYEDDNVRLVAPLTENASKWWGKGTRWCTAADNDNMFLDYFQDSPLLIFDFKDGEKWQLWMNKDEVQFMDEDDNELSDNKIKMKWNKIQNLFKKMLNINGFFLQNIPEEFRTKEISKLAVLQDGEALQYVLYKFRTKELYKLAVQQNGFALQHISDKQKTKELCEIAVKNDGGALQYSLWKNIELCEIAIKQNGWNLQYVPSHIITEELCEMAVKNNGYALYHVPYYMMNEKNIKLALQNNGIALGAIKKESRTKELCKLAVQKNGLALVYVPTEFRTKEICEMAIQNNGSILNYVPTRLRTEKICKLAVEQDGLTLQFVPKEFITKELCEIAIKQNKKSIYYIPNELRTQKNMEAYNKNEIYNNNNLKNYKEIFSELKNERLKL